ncbi:MAG: SpoIIE family protein phosphatase [Actinophytocola sp.]|nr:SpoIIE family protein phosphatase [Actinophytocola sp.]
MPAGRGSEERLRRIEAVTDTALAHVDTTEGLLRELLGRIRELFDADTAVVLMRDLDAGALVPTASVGLDNEPRMDVRVPVGEGFAGAIAAQKRAIALDQVDETTVVNPELLRQGLKSLLGVPMLAEGHVVGVLHIGSLTQRRFSDDDVHLLQVAADRIALATQATLNRTERAAATALQRSLMPPELPAVAGIDLAARYIPGGDAGVGGDWYDLFTLPSGQLGMVIGDVVGSGLRAAVIMGRLRSALRAYALETSDPAVVLDLLDRKVSHFEPNAMATVSYAVFDPATAALDVSLAGHPPPVYACRDQPAVLLDAEPDLPIGTHLPARKRRSWRLEVKPGTVMCFYTDGLVERRDTSVDKGLRLLCGAVHSTDSAEAACADILDALLTGNNPIDDIAVAVLHRE